MTALADRREPSGAECPEGSRPTATRFFPRAALDRAGTQQETLWAAISLLICAPALPSMLFSDAAGLPLCERSRVRLAFDGREPLWQPAGLR